MQKLHVVIEAVSTPPTSENTIDMKPVEEDTIPAMLDQDDGERGPTREVPERNLDAGDGVSSKPHSAPFTTSIVESSM
ncbi:hypothetical protein V6N11_051001 [Hibiscus sabdariffa]|uniref:Uncharacterized protein n=1 Tax=Hibiscus sabdariffa TaxID=183260 RepID=A0ABR2R2J6_9ROSI